MKIIFLFFLLTTTSVFASKEVGNGGDVVVCQDIATGRPKYELLDYYEARVMRGIAIDLNSFVISDEKILALSVLNRLNQINPARANFYARAIEDFFDSQQLLKGVNLVDVPDSQHVFLPTGCHIRQAIIQRAPIFPEDKRYIIDADLWNALDLETKAGLILHEVIYHEALLAEHENSIATRYYHSYLAGNKFQPMTLRGYFDFLQLVQFPDFEINGINVLLCKPVIENDIVKKCGQKAMAQFNGDAFEGEVVPPWAPWQKGEEPLQWIQWEQQKIPVIGSISWYKSDEGGGLKEFTKFYIQEMDGQDQNYNILGPDDYLEDCRVLWKCDQLAGYGRSDAPMVRLNPNGKIFRYVPSDNPTFEVGDVTVRCEVGHQVLLHDDGGLHSCNLDGLQHFVGSYFEAWSQGGIAIEGDWVTALSEIESGVLEIQSPTGQPYKIFPTKFGIHESYLTTFSTARSWKGTIAEQEVEFGPGAYTFEGSHLRTFFLDLTQDFLIPKLSLQKLSLLSGVFQNESDRLAGFNFEGRAYLKNQGGQPTVYIGPGRIHLDWASGEPLVEFCVIENENKTVRSCMTYRDSKNELTSQ